MVCEYELVLQVKIFCLVIGVKEEQRVAIKFYVKAGKSAVEMIELINKAYGSAAMSHANVYRWYAGFRVGREDVKNDVISGRPSTDLAFSCSVFITQVICVFRVVLK